MGGFSGICGKLGQPGGMGTFGCGGVFFAAPSLGGDECF